MNFVWALLAGLALSFWWRDVSRVCTTRRHWPRELITIACALVIFFPIISLTDDLHQQPLAIEDAGTLVTQVNARKTVASHHSVMSAALPVRLPVFGATTVVDRVASACFLDRSHAAPVLQGRAPPRFFS